MRYFIPALLIACAALSGAEIVPPRWTPPKTRPAFPPLQPDTPELKARFDAGIQAADEYTKEVNSWPDDCPQIGVILKDSQLKKLGIEIGDIVTQLDGKPLKGNDIKPFRTEAPQKMTMWRYGKGFWTVDIQPGKLGGNTHGFTRHFLRDLGNTPANPKWDAHIATLKKVFQMEPELAEIALRKAIAAGFPQDARTDAWFAELAVNQRAYTRAMDFGWLAMQKTPDEYAGRSFISAALATGNYAFAADCAKRTPDFPAAGATALEALATQAEALKGPNESPLAQSAALLKDDVMPQLGFMNGTDSAKSLSANRELFYNIQILCFRFMRTKPEVRNLLLREKVAMNVHQGGPAGYLNEYKVDLRVDTAPAGKVDSTNPENGHSAFSIHFQPPRIRIYSGELLNCSLETWEFFKNPDRVHDIELAVVGERAEVRIDGKNYGIFVVPRGTKKLGLAHGVVGMDTAVREQEYYELHDEKDYRAIVQAQGVNTAFGEGWTRLHSAAACGLTREADILLELGAKVATRNSNQESPLHLAVRFNRIETAKVLLTKGATVDLHAAAGLGDLDALKKLVSVPLDGKEVPKNWMPLHAAAVSGNTEAIKVLIENKAVVDAKAFDRDTTPMMLAARYGHREAIDALAAAKGNPSIPDRQKRRPADYARWGGFEELSRFLDTGSTAAPAVRPPRPPEEF